MKSRLWLATVLFVLIALVAGCAKVPRTVRIDNIGAEGYDSPQKLTDSQQQRVVEIILNTPEAKEKPPVKSILRVSPTWTAIVWDNSQYSYLNCFFGLEGVEADPEYQTVPEVAAWYPGATIYFGDPQVSHDGWLIQAAVDLGAGKAVHIISCPYRVEPVSPPPPPGKSP